MVFLAHLHHLILQSKSFSSYSVYLVAKVTVENELSMIHNIILRPEARQLLEQSKQDVFHERFGDFFVQGLKTGGAYYAVLEFTTTSQEEHQKMSAALDISYLAFQAKGDFGSSTDNVKKNTNLIV